MKPTPPIELAEPATGNYFVAAYPPFSCWTGAGAADYRRALERPAEPPHPPLGLYVHVPFCVERCQYCYYLSHDDRPGEVERYLEALEAELRRCVRAPALAGRAPSFVYFGGGTPSLLSTPRVRRLLTGLQEILPWTDAREVTFECAPKSVTRGKLRVLRELGVTRISLGIQQLDDTVLAANGRVHRVEDVEQACAAIQAVGFDTVNLDLMVGLVGETDETFRRSVDRLIELRPDSVTIYQLEIPLNTPLYRSLRDGTLPSPPASWQVKRQRLREGFARLERAGYTVRSAYAAARDPRRTEFTYQDAQYRGADLLGIGTSAFSYFSGVHHQNVASLPGYLDAIKDGGLPLWRGYALDDDERLVREFVLQLKLGSTDAGYFRGKFGVEVQERFREPLARCVERGWMRVDGDAIELTRDGLLRADRLLGLFYLPEHRVERYS